MFLNNKTYLIILHSITVSVLKVLFIELFFKEAFLFSYLRNKNIHCAIAEVHSRLGRTIVVTH